MPSSIRLKDVQGRVDYGIITIRPDEFTAVFERLPERHTIVDGQQFYEFARVPVEGGGERGVAVVRCQSQGELVAHSVAGIMIRELQPRYLLLVGIAGGVPSEDFSLGDVLVASHLHDFSVSAALQGGGAELNVGGGPVHKSVEKLVSHLPALLERLGSWNSQEAIGQALPTVTMPSGIDADEVYGTDDWKRKVIATIRRRFPVEQARRQPKAYVGPTASSNQLVKDADLVKQWQEAARSITHIEMELAGVMQAAREPYDEVPVLAIRGLSDIVGFRRDNDWTTYACYSAASFCFALIKSRVIEEATPWDWTSPRLVHNKVAIVHEWLGSAAPKLTLDNEELKAPTAPQSDKTSPEVPKSAILILGPGGVGKTTLGSFLSGQEDHSPFASPAVYDESIAVEHYALKRPDGPEAMILVPPGQEHRRMATWEALFNGLRDGQFHGVIFLVAYGYHSLGQIRWKEHTLAKGMKRKSLGRFMEAYLDRQRAEELQVLKEVLPYVQACQKKLWLITLVGKEDLWYSDQTKVSDHYRTGAYGAAIQELERERVGNRFRHEQVLASLVINNFTSSAGERLALNQAGYDRITQVKSLRRLVEVFDSLRRWERDQ